MVFDEVITAFGRTESGFVWSIMIKYPDFISLSKGLTSGYLPLSATVYRVKFGRKLKIRYRRDLFLQMLLTTSNHAASCAVALANIEIIEKENLLKIVSDKENIFKSIKKQNLRKIRWLKRLEDWA